MSFLKFGNKDFVPGISSDMHNDTHGLNCWFPSGKETTHSGHWDNLTIVLKEFGDQWRSDLDFDLWFNRIIKKKKTDLDSLVDSLKLTSVL